MTGIGTDWRLLEGVTTAWFEAPSLIEGAALAGRVADVSDGILVDVRPTGVRVRLDSDRHAEEVSDAARDVGLRAEPAALQQLKVVLESADPFGVTGFWQRVLDYTAGESGALADPLQRDPAFRVQPSAEVRPLRNRLHLDVSRPVTVLEQASPGQGAGPWGVRHSDPDGNEVDLVPGDPLGETARTADWESVWSAMACYRTTTPAQQRDLTSAAAGLAVDAGFPLRIDVRPGLVIIDSGKDQWDAEAHGLDLDFTDLATGIQTVARALGLRADPTLPRFVQLFLDAADVDVVRGFWMAALGYVRDRRDGVSDIYDPHGLNRVLVF